MWTASPRTDRRGRTALYKLAEQGVAERGFQLPQGRDRCGVHVANAAYQRDGGLAGISTGLIDLDKKLGGLHPSDLIILAGRPSMGKTSLATNIAFNIAKAYRRGLRPTGPRGHRRRGGGLFQPRNERRTAGRAHPVRGGRGAQRTDPPRRHDRRANSAASSKPPRRWKPARSSSTTPRPADRQVAARARG
jgi:hypothetical protein